MVKSVGALKKYRNWIILVVLLAAVGGGGLFLKHKGEEAVAEVNRQLAGKIETAQVETRTLIDSLAATGTVVSADSKEVRISTMNGYKVIEMDLSVGDYINEGDKICAFDTENLLETMADLRKQLASTEAVAGIQIGAGERGVNEATTNYNIDAARSAEDLAEAQKNYDKAVSDRAKADQEWSDAIENTEQLRKDMDYWANEAARRKTVMENAEKRWKKAQKGDSGSSTGSGSSVTADYVRSNALSRFSNTLENTLKPLVEGTSNYNADLLYSINIESSDWFCTADQLAPEAGDSFSSIASAINALEQAKSEYDNAYTLYASLDAEEGDSSETASGTDVEKLEKKYYDAVADYIEASSKVSTYQNQLSTSLQAEASRKAAYNSADSMVDNAKTAVTARERAQEDYARNDTSNIYRTNDSWATAQQNGSVAGLSMRSQLRSYEDLLEDSIALAPISGMITAVNFENGDMYSATAPLITIEDASAYKVEAQIEEYDIAKVKVGQSVAIKTNGTGDAQLEGTVVEIAPRATPGVGGVTYKVTCTIDTPNDDLRLDMTAKLSIILEKNVDVLTVPYDAVQVDEQGQFYVEAADEGYDPAAAPDSEAAQAKHKILVSKGIESDYYIQIISDEITEGMTILIPASQKSGLTLEDLMNGGAMGGF